VQGAGGFRVMDESSQAERARAHGAVPTAQFPPIQYRNTTRLRFLIEYMYLSMEIQRTSAPCHTGKHSALVHTECIVAGTVVTTVACCKPHTAIDAATQLKLLY
jgi:hypothetical protein